MKRLHTSGNPASDERPAEGDGEAGRPTGATAETFSAGAPGAGPEAEAHTAPAHNSQAELHAQIKTKAEMLRWIMHSRSWRYTAWVRRACFLGLRLGPRLRKPGRDPFRGQLDSPADGERVSQRIKVEGWAHSERSSVAYVEVFLDAISIGHLRYGLPRLDAAAFPTNAPVNCGYEGTVNADESLAGRRRLTVRVTDTGGRVKDYERTVEVVISNARSEAGAPPAGGLSLAPSPALVPRESSLSAGKMVLEVAARAALESLLCSDSLITFPPHESPEVSVLLVLYNRAELTLQCLNSILQHHRTSYEVIIVNNASTDETGQLLGRVRGARVVNNPTNVHYLRACNQAARLARGRNILLLNNDAQLLGASIASAAETLDSSPDIGAVGGRIILADGSLQEAGSIIWRDGSCHGYGRGGSPFAPEFMFRRDVDYCSAVFLLTRRELFLGRGGFDESFAPAYYEDADYCAGLWREGLRVVYDPRVSVLHYESASSASPRSVLDMQAKNRQLFVQKHREWLRSRRPVSAGGALRARSQTRSGQKRILYLDDRVPHRDTGGGFPRSNRVLAEFVRLGHAVTCYPLTAQQEGWHEVYRDLPMEVEVAQGRGHDGLAEFLNERVGYYDVIYVSRPHNLTRFQALLSRQPHICGGAKVIYDSEALVALRDVERLRVRGKTVSEGEQEDRVAREVRLAEGCHLIVSVSELDRRAFARHGLQNVHTLGHGVEAAPTPGSFDARRDILFVGAVHDADSPNADSVRWFTRRILPVVRKDLGAGVKLLVAGNGSRDFLCDLNSEGVELLGQVGDLIALYDRARIFVAPTRFAAGIPLKVLEAAAHGLPVVATTLLGRQLGWAGGVELLLADDAEGFADACVRLYRDAALWRGLRASALRRIEADYSPPRFAERVKAILDSA